MKTLILASSNQFITVDNVKLILPMSSDKVNILYVTTASKKVDDASYVKLTKQKMKGLGLSYTEFDIAGKSYLELREALKYSNVLYVEGGNTFYLLKTVRETGFEKIVKEEIENGLIYWGVSAGSYIACPSIIMATWFGGVDECGVIDWNAMSLVPFLINAHSTPGNLEFLKEKSKNLRYLLRVLNDEQALLIRGEEVRLIGTGEEIIL